MKLKIGKLVISYGDPCQTESCTYFTHYLRYGPPSMSHAAFHKAEEECLTWQKRAMDYLDRGEDVPDYVERMCRKLEAEIRA